MNDKTWTVPGYPLPQPENGYVFTLYQGRFLMRLMGGQRLTLVFEHPDYLPVQRQVDVPSDGDLRVPTVTMIARSNTYSQVTLNSAAWQTTAGDQVTDSRGTRKARLLIPPSTTITSPANAPSSANLRITEYTGTSAKEGAMPAQLPPTSAYTYAVDLSLDELGDQSVTFSQPLPYYIEGFLAVPVGYDIPSGYYDKQQGVWRSSPNGRVIKILSVASGVAAIDTDGDNAADSGLGITPGERTYLGSLVSQGAYSVGQVLWRIPITHFSIYDFNLPYAPSCTNANGATACVAPPAPAKEKQKNNRAGDSCKQSGSIIVCDNQVLGEVTPVLGTPYALFYSSERVPGRTAENSFKVQLRDSTVTLPPELSRVLLEVSVAGKVTKLEWPGSNFPPDHTFTWDGKDSLGRSVQGVQEAVFRVGYEYPAKYAATKGAQEDAFGKLAAELVASGNVTTVDGEGGPTITLWREHRELLGNLDARSLGLGGWTLSAHHQLDILHNIVYLGDGTTYDATALGATIDLVLRDSHIGALAGVAPLSDGSVVIPWSDDATGKRTLRRIYPNGASDSTFALWTTAFAAASGCGGSFRRDRPLLLRHKATWS